MIVGAIEAGGTKFVCGIVSIPEERGAPGSGEAPPGLIARTSIATADSASTIAACIEWFESASVPLDALGIGCFGPVDLDPRSATWGCITSTPKLAWRGVSIAPVFRTHFGIPVGFDTDVNAAALGEATWGAARGLSDAVYITVGTGIGGGILSGGKLVHGRLHPELGHFRVARIGSDDYVGSCPYHRDCLEGLAAGPAITGRWGLKAETLPATHPAWELEAAYLAQACTTINFILSPQIILIGGGVGMRPGLAERVEALCTTEVAGYLDGLDPSLPWRAHIRRPALGHDAGLYGAVALGMAAAAAHRIRQPGT